MKSLTDCFKLSNGVEIPCIGYGTFQAANGDECTNGVLDAINFGYRHVDTAQGYQNEESVGIAVKKSGVPRSEIFITSKLTNKIRGYKETITAFEGTLEKLDMEYVDLMLIHWPNPVHFRDNWKGANAESWRAFEDLYNDKKIRSIGISNFLPHHIDALMETAKVAPMVNQIRLCPGDTQDESVDYCRSKNILLQAYSPFGTGLIFDIPEMKALADKYGKSIAQICVRWCLQRDYLPLPKSSTTKRIKENAEIFDFELEAADVQLIADMKGCIGYSKDPDTTAF
ncbi:MAG: aldo/keto reductase [Oscillospiraceae bacterium]|jgi:diketogulonate reductase-like aldo/keto reductase|nr:aldo/keto reductase [Oscillospiraceae bacterium]